MNLKEVKILTHKNKMQNLIEIIRAYKNNPQLYILNKIGWVRIRFSLDIIAINGIIEATLKTSNIAIQIEAKSSK